MRKVWNFSAGPAQVPVDVLKKAQEELLSYKGSGMSVMELSHRSPEFQEIIDEAEMRLRRLLQVSDDYAVLFLQGGASLQFLMAPMNLKVKGKAAFIDTGTWSNKAIVEAENLDYTVDVIGTSAEKNYSYIPEETTDFTDYDYVHITTNNTIEGTAFTKFPDTQDVPLVADMSSNILAEPLDVNQFGLIYAGAQKNLGIAGLTIVIIRKDLLDRVEDLPNLMSYKTLYEKGSLYNTPPTFAIYMTKLVFKWLEDLGGLEKMGELNREKAQILYDYLDQSTLFKAPIKGKDRSLMNVPFVTGDAKIDQAFIEFAQTQGIKNIKGHRSIGGMRASIYNAMPLEGVEALIDVMKAFEQAEQEKE